MVDFNTVWPILVKRAQEIDTVDTFKQGNTNEVQYDEDRDAICFYSRASDNDYWTAVPRHHWKTAWDELHGRGKLEPNQFRERTNVRRGSTLVPFLQTALDLPVDTDERIIYPPKDDGRFSQSTD
jgi:hypothetical protein